ncbi:DUF6503 family protein [Geojedonia litorea]|uniref:DUF6503 family protein n=1 Tax=Geojedonia litorea TaxID=1268269 RepID=A0ABV9N6U4_9FLAO
MKTTSIFFCLAFTLFSFGQSITGPELLKKAIAYHDPNGNWTKFNDSFTVTMTSPKTSKRVSSISINLPRSYFRVNAVKDDVSTEYIINKGQCTIRLNGKTDLTDEDLKTHNLSCDRANLYKNYYTYLYGLPMKLKDQGTIVDPLVELKKFKGTSYLRLQVTYDKAVGTDVWYFYFNPKTYALEVYQFYKTDENGLIKADSGEYILLSEIEIIKDIKIPKVRAWYYNKDNVYLGTDTLTK